MRIDKKKLEKYNDHLVNRLLYWQGKGLRRTSHAEKLLGKRMVEYNGDELHMIELFITDLNYLKVLYNEAVE